MRVLCEKEMSYVSGGDLLSELWDAVRGLGNEIADTLRDIYNRVSGGTLSPADGETACRLLPAGSTQCINALRQQVYTQQMRDWTICEASAPGTCGPQPTPPKLL